MKRITRGCFGALARSWKTLLAGASLLAAAGPAAWATDGSGAQPPPSDGSQSSTYYESTVGTLSTSSAVATTPSGLPTALWIEDSSARVEYRVVASGSSATEWEVRVLDFLRRHERVDGIYDMVLVLPLPATSDGSDAFTTSEAGVAALQGDPSAPTPLVYGGEAVVFKRNFALEKMWLPQLVSASGETGKLPSLAGTGYRYTIWDTIVRYDPNYGDVVQGWGQLRYETEPKVSAPDASDPRLAAYLITWLPSLPANPPPYAVRMDVVEPAP